MQPPIHVHTALDVARRIGHQHPMHLRAYSVHLLTAIGAGLAMLAILAAAQTDWRTMFLWLLAALVVDGIDGPLARRFDVRTNAPRIDGALLDLVIDFLTYVFIPLFALFQSGLLPGWTGWAVVLVVTVTSALYFADDRMKTLDGSFEGFPACWNIVVLVFFATQPPAWIMLATIVVLTPAMFLNIRFVHPIRTARWRAVSLPVTLIWMATAALAMWWPGPAWHGPVLIASSLYLLFAGAVQQVTAPRG